MEQPSQPEEDLVPNAPCGVESWIKRRALEEGDIFVPNAPCGVESYDAFCEFFI